jgi:hypothetical protein
LLIFEANSTPMVWEERMRHSFFRKRWSRQDLEMDFRVRAQGASGVEWWNGKGLIGDGLASTTGTEQDDFGEVVVHATKFLMRR